MDKSSVIKLDKNYQESLTASRPSIINKTQIGKFGARQIPVVIPPLNTNITFFGALPHFKLPAKSQYKFSASATLPESWNWKDVHSSDSDEIKSKKQIITKPQNQAKCGSCWAISTAGVMSDVFVVEKGYNPNISTTYSLACYPQGQCKGGFPPSLINDISESGVASDHCVDYSWCLTNEKCSGLGQSHFDVTMDQVNALIPECGCYDPNNHFLYFIKNQNVIYYDESPNIVEIIKSHVYNHGPTIGGYHVFDNFMFGDFSKTNGVYLESIDYNGPGYFLSHGPTWKGSHAVAIIGWGVEKNIKILDKNGNEKVSNVPYWFVRNSWGPNWGANGGYFKIAMYPYNKKAQFEKLVDVETPFGIARTGGIITFVSGDVKPNKFQQIRGDKKLMDKYFYDKDEPVVEVKPKKRNDRVKGGENEPVTQNKNWKYWIGISIVSLIIIFMIYYIIKNRRKIFK